MTDHVLDRITYRPPPEQTARFAMPTWPAGYAPKQTTIHLPSATSVLPPAKAVILTYTYAEAEALLRLCGAGQSWDNYAEGFASYKPELTDRSPARDAKCMARVAYVEGRNGPVVLVHSMLHLATDAASMPLVRLFDQIIEETGCEVFIDTGTAGGIGADKDLGDVIAVENVKFKGVLPVAFGTQASYKATLQYSSTLPEVVAPLFTANVQELPPANRPAKVWFQDDITVLTFEFSTSTDQPFGLRVFDPNAGCEDMDLFALPAAIAKRLTAGKPCPVWGSFRNISDPEADMSLYYTIETAKKQMAEIYQKYGLPASYNSVCAAWMTVNL